MQVVEVQDLRVPSKRVAMVSRKVFWGASNPFITGIFPAWCEILHQSLSTRMVREESAKKGEGSVMTAGRGCLAWRWGRSRQGGGLKKRGSEFQPPLLWQEQPRERSRSPPRSSGLSPAQAPSPAPSTSASCRNPSLPPAPPPPSLRGRQCPPGVAARASPPTPPSRKEPAVAWGATP